MTFPFDYKGNDSFLNNLMEGCQVIDTTWHYVFINEAAAKHGRHPRDFYIGHTITQLYPEIEDTALFKKLEVSMHKHVPESIENEFKYPDGDKGWFELRILPVTGGILVLSTDISDRKNLEFLK